MEIKQSTENGIQLYKLSGNLLGETYGTPLLDRIKQQVADGGTRFVLNLADLKFVNSTGIGTLIAALTRARNAGGDLVLVAVPQQLDKMLQITKLDKLFTAFENEQEAIQSLVKS